MSDLSNDRVFVSARLRRIQKAQLAELALSEGRTNSSMLRCLIERAYGGLLAEQSQKQQRRKRL